MILKLIGKYSLPLSPILEYAIKEKIEEFGGDEGESAISETIDETKTEEPIAQSLIEDDIQYETHTASSSRYIIRVKYPNGSVFCSNWVWETLVDVINYAGPERVRQLNIICMGDNLVSPYLNNNPKYRSAQKELGRGLYVCTYSSTETKYNQIERINESLRLGLKIEKVNADDVDTDNVRVDKRESHHEREALKDSTQGTRSFGGGGKSLSKRRFVLETVKSYVRHNPDVSYETLLRIFPATLNYNKANGVIKRYNDVIKKCTINPRTRDYFFLKNSEVIQLANGQKVVVHSQWGDDFEKFLKVAESLFHVEKQGGGYVLDATSIHNGYTTTSQTMANGDKRIGYTVRLFPSQQIGVIVEVRTDSRGIKKLVVRTNEGNTMVIDDLPYLYEVLKRGSEETSNLTSEREETVDWHTEDEDDDDSSLTDDIDTEEEPDDAEEASLDDLEVEHVFVDSSGRWIDSFTTNSASLEKEPSTENRRGKPWTEGEENQLRMYFKQGRDTATIAAIMGRTEVAIKSQLGMMGLIDYTYGQEEETRTDADKEEQEKDDESDFAIENSFARCFIVNKRGDRVFQDTGKLKYIGGKLYRMNLKEDCFTLKSMRYDGAVWTKGEKRIVAYPPTALYRALETAVNYYDEVEEIVDAMMFEKCQLKVGGVWYRYDGSLLSNRAGKDEKAESVAGWSLPNYTESVVKSPLYAVRKQAVLRAMGYFRLPASVRDIARTISRTAWRTTIREDEVEDVIRTMSEIESVDGKYMLRRNL